MSQHEKAIKILSEKSLALRDIGNGLGFLGFQIDGPQSKETMEIIMNMNNDVQEIAEALEELMQELKS